MGRAWRTKRNFVSRLTNKRNEGNIMYRFKQKIITIKSDKSIQDIYIKIKRINPKFIFDVIPDFHNFNQTENYGIKKTLHSTGPFKLELKITIRKREREKRKRARSK